MNDDTTGLHAVAAYGILRRRSTLEAVIGHKWPGKYQDILVDGWTKYKKKSGIWYAHQEEGKILDAKLITGLTNWDLAKLDRLEGVPVHYQRVRVTYMSADDIGECFIYQDGKWRDPSEQSPEPPRSNAPAFPLTTVPAGPRQTLEDLADAMGILSRPAAHPGLAGPGAGAPPWATGERPGHHRAPEAPHGSSGTPPPPESPGDATGLPLFAYGALTFREVLEERIGHIWESEYQPASLVGWVIESGWPRHAIEQVDGIAFGFKLSGLTTQDLEIIDRYEGVAKGVYRRIVVTLEDGTRAWFYSAGPAGLDRIRRRRNGQEAKFRPFISGQKVGG